MIRCMYCGRAAQNRLDGESGPVCGACWSLLSSQETALRLIRGHMTAALRGRMPPEQLRAAIERYLEGLRAAQV